MKILRKDQKEKSRKNKRKAFPSEDAGFHASDIAITKKNQMSDYFWEFEKEKQHFIDIWDNRPHTMRDHSAAAWDRRADKWVREITDTGNIRKKRSENRILKTGEFLRSRGLLGPGTTVIDIGCGPGRFVAEFAKTAGHVTGTDISPRMLELGKEYTDSMGLYNVSYEATDFKEFNPEDLGWKGAFDLCFSSITPALNNYEAVEKMESMSRKYCFSSNFVKAEDVLAEKVRSALFPQNKRPNAWDGRTFYAMFNLLWLKGRYPEITYFKESDNERLPADENLAVRILDYISEEFESQVGKVVDYIRTRADEDGFITYESTRWYGWMLWDVTEDGRRAY